MSGWKRLTKQFASCINTAGTNNGSPRCMPKVVVTATKDDEKEDYMVDEIFSLDLTDSPELQALIRRQKSKSKTNNSFYKCIGIGSKNIAVCIFIV